MRGGIYSIILCCTSFFFVQILCKNLIQFLCTENFYRLDLFFLIAHLENCFSCTRKYDWKKCAFANFTVNFPKYNPTFFSGQASLRSFLPAKLLLFFCFFFLFLRKEWFHFLKGRKIFATKVVLVWALMNLFFSFHIKSLRKVVFLRN